MSLIYLYLFIWNWGSQSCTSFFYPCNIMGWKEPFPPITFVNVSQISIIYFKKITEAHGIWSNKIITGCSTVRINSKLWVFRTFHPLRERWRMNSNKCRGNGWLSTGLLTTANKEGSLQTVPSIHAYVHYFFCLRIVNKTAKSTFLGKRGKEQTFLYRKGKEAEKRQY